ncbi:MAG: hypothetical protein IT330_11400 [Anaerolineae bacterium]|nr:hypothetical protein [Anaerolineae bacterium]
MASLNDLQLLIGKAMLDDGFRAWLFKEPEAAAASVGIKLSESQAKRIRDLGPEAGDKLAACVRETIGSPNQMMWGG